ncbi:MAG: FAD-dependent oxidoreductase [Gemmatimonadaceae bacterium]
MSKAVRTDVVVIGAGVAGLAAARALRERGVREDPFSRGAYSYPLVGGSKAGATLARPIRGTLYVAGEATIEEAESGTVHGAMRSGHRAAKQLARQLGVSS